MPPRYDFSLYATVSLQDGAPKRDVNVGWKNMNTIVISNINDRIQPLAYLNWTLLNGGPTL